MFVLSALGSIALDGLAIALFLLQRDDYGSGATFPLRMVDVIVCTALRLVFLTIFATIFYRKRCV